MKITHLNAAIVCTDGPCAATIGFFDGVHLGHQFLIRHVVEEARHHQLRAVAITFDLHPLQVLHQHYQPELLSTLEEKLERLSMTGLDEVMVLHFDKMLSLLSAYDFMQQVLHDQLHVSRLIMGYDNRFGHNRAETFDHYVSYGREMGMEVILARSFTIDGIQISSSVVRAFLKEGEIRLANRCLGYPYTLKGHVVGGFREGRKMGFPTANLDIGHQGLLVPADGVYATRVSLQGQADSLPAMTSVGCRPTFHGTHQTIETYIFDYQGDIYDQPMSLSFIQRTRSEQQFANVSQLVMQMKADEQQIRQILKQ